MIGLEGAAATIGPMARARLDRTVDSTRWRERLRVHAAFPFATAPDRRGVLALDTSVSTRWEIGLAVFLAVCCLLLAIGTIWLTTTASLTPAWAIVCWAVVAVNGGLVVWFVRTAIRVERARPRLARTGGGRVELHDGCTVVMGAPEDVRLLVHPIRFDLRLYDYDGVAVVAHLGGRALVLAVLRTEGEAASYLGVLPRWLAERDEGAGEPIRGVGILRASSPHERDRADESGITSSG